MRHSGVAGVIAIGAACAVLAAYGSSDSGGPRAWDAGTAGAGAIQDMEVDAATSSLPAPIERPDGVPVFLPAPEADWSTPRTIVGGLEGSEHADLLAQHLGLAENDLRSQLHGWSVALLPADTAVREYRTGDEQPRPVVLGTAAPIGDI